VTTDLLVVVGRVVNPVATVRMTNKHARKEIRIMVAGVYRQSIQRMSRESMGFGMLHHGVILRHVILLCERHKMTNSTTYILTKLS
jgi:hypothetical protein